jgi:hypothetical protein
MRSILDAAGEIVVPVRLIVRIPPPRGLSPKTRF